MLCSQNYAAWIHRHYHETSDCSEYPKISLLQSSLPKKYLPNFPTKKILELKMSSPKRKPSIIPMTLKSGLAPAPPAGCVNRIILKLLLLIHIVYPTLLAESLSFFLGKFTLRVSRVSNQSFNIPSQSTPWTFEFFLKINIQIPTAWAKMPFKYLIIVSF